MPPPTKQYIMIMVMDGNSHPSVLRSGALSVILMDNLAGYLDKKTAQSSENVCKQDFVMSI